MTSAFPAVSRFRYAKGPLVDVICQLRFPSILRIDVEPPAQLQDRIRSAFPQFARTARMFVPLGTGDAGSGVPTQNPLRHANEYKFSSDDGSWVFSLNQDFLALQTSSYTQWEDFWARLSPVLNAFVEVYSPSHFTRLGLRYVDMISREGLGVADTPWSNLINPQILGALADSQLMDAVEEAAAQVRLREPDGSSGTLLQHGLGQTVSDGKPAYVIDFDVYRVGRISHVEVEQELERLRGRAGAAFRWSITNELHKLLDPSPIP